MADNDIYNNKGKYEYFKENYKLFAIEPAKRQQGLLGKNLPMNSNRGKYYCKNKENLFYFQKLFDVFEATDISFVRRNRILGAMRLICFATEKNLKDLDREGINKIVSYMHTTHNTPQSKSDFIKAIKHLWKTLFPEKDEKGRADDTIIPYPIRHLSPKIDKSREKRRGDKLTWEEFESIVKFFSNDPRMQSYLTLSLESLGRPQEILYTKIKDVELYDNYAKIWISEHGKEGIGFLQCIDSYPYLMKWLQSHPLRDKKDAFLFINLSDREYGQQLKPKNINSKLHTACKYLKIDKPVASYSLKRNGVTFRRLRGDSDVEIQHAARWTSTKQLKTYDMSHREESFKIELVKRGLIKDAKYVHLQPQVKECTFCSKKNDFTSEFCETCKRPLDRTKIVEQEKSRENEFVNVKRELEELKNKFESSQRYVTAMNKFFENEKSFKALVEFARNGQN